MTLADEDTKSIQTNNANRATQGNVATKVAKFSMFLFVPGHTLDLFSISNLQRPFIPFQSFPIFVATKLSHAVYEFNHMSAFGNMSVFVAGVVFVPL